jgi:hypothetical protein
MGMAFDRVKALMPKRQSREEDAATNKEMTYV